MSGLRKKTWYWKDLQDSKASILQRCQLIEKTADSSPCIPATHFEDKGEQLIQIQRLIKPAKKLAKSNLNKNSALNLAIELDNIATAGLVHGDILPRHLLYHQEQYWLIDWEPCFWQFRDEEWTFIATAPYIAPSEWGTTKELSSLSDKYAFISSCHRVLTGKFYSKSEQIELEQAADSLSFEQLLHQFILKLF